MLNDKGKILLVEDDTMILELYQKKFTDLGYTVLVASRGDEVVAMAEKELPKAVLLDVILPGVDGFAILEQLKNNPITTSIPVVMLTNLGQDEDKEKGKQLGAAGYIVKATETPSGIVKKVEQLIINK